MMTAGQTSRGQNILFVFEVLLFFFGSWANEQISSLEVVVPIVDVEATPDVVIDVVLDVEATPDVVIDVAVDVEATPDVVSVD